MRSCTFERGIVGILVLFDEVLGLINTSARPSCACCANLYLGLARKNKRSLIVCKVTLTLV